MSKKNAIILITIVFLIILGFLLYFYFFFERSTNQSTVNISVNEENLLPFGGQTTEIKNITNQTSSTTNPSNSTTTQTKLPQIRKIYASPVSGAVIFSKDNKNKTRFVDRATGNIYENPSDSEQISRISNNTIPKIYEAIWDGKGLTPILRYLEDDTDNIESFSVKISLSGTSTATAGALGSITGNFLSPNITALAINPAGTKIFSLLEKTDGSGSYGTISNMDGASKKQIFDSLVSKWLVSWPKSNIVTLTTKPNYKSYGFLYFLNTDTGSIQRILGNKIGMTTLVNKTTDLALYSENNRGIPGLNLFDIKNNSNKNLQISTLTDKCAWSNNDRVIVYCAVPDFISGGQYPDAWYQGLVSFNDNIWKINIEEGTTNLIYQASSESVDVVDMRISPDDKYLIFTNKNDLSLWGLEVK